jgi:hypothetical protein
LRTIDIATGLSIAPPIASNTRKATSSSRLGASAHSSDASENSASPAWYTRRRPRRSAVDPASISRLASTSVYASTVHCRPDSVEWNERWMAGSATLTIVASKPTISRLIEQVTRMSRRRRRSGIPPP